ncbi:MAG: 23S rRNA (guanosine(2251)-2'-O)-methyltransferase RlmB [Immundisolibacterales bacterium]|nr:23S rRNA (guanosine(2251)-2'-O)-methyltransferase RlmB [Immundisolibacterales bacterium]
MPVPASELVYGLHALGALLDEDPSVILEVWVGATGPRAVRLAERIAAMGISVRRCDRGTLDRLAPGARHQGVVARVRSRPAPSWRSVLDQVAAAPLRRGRDEPPPLLLVLDQVQDPRNLGACVRSAAAAGATAVVVPRRRAAGVTAAVRRTAAGGTERVPVVEVPNLARALRDLSAGGLTIAGADAGASTPAWSTDLTGPLALVLGAEEGGLRRLTREHCDHLAAIPMTAGGASLNVSVATGILLYEVLRQRHAAASGRSGAGARNG